MSITQVKATVNSSDHLLTYTATDDAGNTASVDDSDLTLGQSLRLIVVEQVIPAINITFPGDDALYRV